MNNFKDLVPIDNIKNYIGGYVSIQNDSDDKVKIQIFSEEPCLDYIESNNLDDKYYRIEFLNPKESKCFSKLLENSVELKISNSFKENDYRYTIPRGINCIVIKPNLDLFFFNMV